MIFLPPARAPGCRHAAPGAGWLTLPLVLVLWLSALGLVPAATSITATNKFAYGADVGWIDTRGNTNSGAVIGEFVCSGYLYGANIGWIHLGSNAPANGIQYQNNSATDYGINHDGLGNLRGFAYAANVGWINFESSGAPKVDLRTGRLTGSVFAANAGWISLSNAFAFVQTATIPGGTDSNFDGMPDAWERIYFSTIGVNPNGDADGDGVSNSEEYMAGTNPTNSADHLKIVTFATTPAGTSGTIAWSSVLTREYFIQTNTNLVQAWIDNGGVVVPTSTLTTRPFTDVPSPSRLYRIQAHRPLAP